MRSIFVGLIILSASMAVASPAQAQQHTQRSPGYGHMHARISHWRPPKDGLQRSDDDLKTIEKDNGDLDLPASQDDVIGAGQVRSEEEALTKRIEQDSVRLDREVGGLCGGC